MKTNANLLCSRRNAPGFTLPELMIALSISAVILGIAVPNMTDLIRDARLASQTDFLVRTINEARMGAIKQRTNFKLCPSATPNTATACSTAATDWVNGWLVIEGNNISQRVSGKSSVTVTSAATEIEFRGTLGTPTAAISFTVCAKGRKQQTVNVSASGHVDKRIDATVCS